MELDDPRISENQAALVLDRAAQLDATRGREVQVNELREAALEAGISQEAFDRALGEVASVWGELTDPSNRPIRVQDPADPRTSSWSHRARVLASGFALGTLALILDGLIGDAGILFALLLALFTAIGLMLKRRGRRAILAFEVDLIMLWVGITLLVMVGHRNDADEFLAAMTFAGAITALLGGTVVALRRPEESPAQLPRMASIDVTLENKVPG